MRTLAIPKAAEEFGGPLWRSPHDAPLEVWGPFALWGFAALAGLVALSVGLSEARFVVPKNLLGAFWSICVMVGLGVLCVKVEQVLPPDPLAGYAVRGVSVTGLAVMAVYLWIVSGLGLASARRRIIRQILRRNRRMRPVRGSQNW